MKTQTWKLMCNVNANNTLVQIDKEMIDLDSFRRSYAMCLYAFHIS